MALPLYLEYGKAVQGRKLRGMETHFRLMQNEAMSRAQHFANLFGLALGNRHSSAACAKEHAAQGPETKALAPVTAAHA